MHVVMTLFLAAFHIIVIMSNSILERPQ